MPDNPGNLDISQILNILPHRYPFLLVDRVLEIDLEKGYVLAQKNVTINESFFQGHFPQVPIMPGVLILEALAQAGGVLVHLKVPSNKIAIPSFLLQWSMYKIPPEVQRLASKM